MSMLEGFMAIGGRSSTGGGWSATYAPNMERLSVHVPAAEASRKAWSILVNKDGRVAVVKTANTGGVLTLSAKGGGVFHRKVNDAIAKVFVDAFATGVMERIEEGEVTLWIFGVAKK